MSTNEEMGQGSSNAGEPTPRSRRTHTSSSFKPPSLQKGQSTQSYGSIKSNRPRQERQPTGLSRIKSARTQHGHDSELAHRQTTQDSRRAHANAHSLQRQQTEKKPDEKFVVDNNYFDLNPWYDQEPKKPVFGMNKPLPRTVRPGMLWGRKNLHSQTGGLQQKDRPTQPTLHIPLNEEQEPPPDVFGADIGGLDYEVRRKEPPSGNEEDNGIDSQDHATEKDNENDENLTQSLSQMEQKNSGHLSPLEETDSIQSFETTQTQKEKKEVQEHEKEALQDYYDKYRNPLARLRAKYPEAPAEFLCTTIYVFFSIAGSLYTQTYPAQQGDYQTQAWATGLAVMAGIYVGGGVSGAHMSPWISFSFSVFRGFPWKMCLIYSIAQILAGFAAGALAWFIYRDGIRHVDPGLTDSLTGMAFYSVPQTYVSITTAFFNNFVSAAMYVCVVFAIGDDSNTPPAPGMSALIFGLLTYLLCITMGYNGLGISPARDLGPRFIAWWVGYGSETFSTGWWAYGPLFAGLSGSLVGAFAYDAFIFSGGESPVNYNWPKPGDIKERIREWRQEKKEMDWEQGHGEEV